MKIRGDSVGTPVTRGEKPEPDSQFLPPQAFISIKESGSERWYFPLGRYLRENPGAMLTSLCRDQSDNDYFDHIRPPDS